MQYAIRERKDYINPDNPGKYYPYPKYVGKVTLRDLSENIVKASSLTRGDVENVILNLIDEITYHLKDGRSVQLDEFCTLRLSFSAEGSDTPEEATHHKIKKLNFIFKPGKGLLKNIKDIRFRKI